MLASPTGEVETATSCHLLKCARGSRNSTIFDTSLPSDSSRSALRLASGPPVRILPEPSTWALLARGAGALLLGRRRRR